MGLTVESKGVVEIVFWVVNLFGESPAWGFPDYFWVSGIFNSDDFLGYLWGLGISWLGDFLGFLFESGDFPVDSLGLGYSLGNFLENSKMHIL